MTRKVKDSHERLLDMLHDWQSGIEEDRSDSYTESICNLYQEAGAQENMTDDDVKKFLLEKVFLVLCEGT